MDKTEGMSTSTNILVNFILSSLLITILIISYESARRYFLTTSRLLMKYLTRIHIKFIRHARCVVLLQRSGSGEKVKSSAFLISRVLWNCWPNKFATILIQVWERDLLQLKGTWMCVEIKAWDCSWGDGGLTATLAPRHLCSIAARLCKVEGQE